MSRLRKSSMKEQCYEIIREKILKQEYDLGEYISIAALSGELSVSNTPIREALSQLEADGLVISSLNAKVRVISFDSISFREMTQTVKILSAGAYDLCVKEGRVEHLTELMRESLAKQETLLRQGNFHQFIHECIAFDRCPLAALGNNRLLSVFDGISGVLFLMFRTNHQRDGSHRGLSVQEHGMILRSVESGERDIVMRLLEHHYNKTL